MITSYDITADAWTTITTAGESGSCWLAEEKAEDAGTVDVRVIHSVSGMPSVADLLNAKRVYRSKSNNDLCIISADSLADVYYARCKDAGSTAKLIVDVV